MTPVRRTDWPRYAWLALLVVAALVSLLGLRGWWHGATVTSRVESVAHRLEQAVTEQPESKPESAQPGGPDRHGTDGNGSKEANDPGTLAVQRINQRHLFAPKPPDQFRNIQGVLGDRVLYAGGQSFAVGENAMGATVKAVNSEWVEFEFKGETIRIETLSAGGGGRARRGEGGGRRRGRRNGN